MGKTYLGKKLPHIFGRRKKMVKKYKLNRPIQRIIRFNEEENEYINKKIEESLFVNFQNFARILLITGEVRMVDYSELKKLSFEVNRVGNNINQIAKIAHKFEEISNEDIQELLRLSRELKKSVAIKFNEELQREKTV